MPHSGERFPYCPNRDMAEYNVWPRNLTANAEMLYTPANEYETRYDFKFNGTCGYGIHYAAFDPAVYSAQVFIVLMKNDTSTRVHASIISCDGSFDSHTMTENDTYVVIPSTKVFIYVERSPATGTNKSCAGIDTVSYVLVGLEDACSHTDQIPRLPECKDAKAKVVTTSPSPSVAGTSAAPYTAKRSVLVSVLTACLVVAGGLSTLC